MASGVKVSDQVTDLFHVMKIHKTGEDIRERNKFVLLTIKNGEVVIDKVVQVKELECEKKIYKKITKMLPKKKCAYALYDCCYKTKENASKDELIFMMWAPEDAPIKDRMVYASSCECIKKSFSGCKAWQINDQADVTSADCLIDKLGGRGAVKALEGEIPERACQDSDDDDDDDACKGGARKGATKT